jgi:CBS domain containing-hemolysin-like protein
MTWFLTVLDILIFIALIMVAAVQPVRSTMSNFELTRRKEQGDKTASALIRRERLLGDVFSLQRIALALLLVIFVAVTVPLLGWFFGILLAVIVALEYGALARIDAIWHMPQRYYERFEPALLNFVEKYQGLFKFVRGVSPARQDAKLESREELKHLVSQSGSLLSSDEKNLILHGLQFGDRQVSEIMTPRSVIDTIDEKELLGPLVLNDLHKTGHSRFPVTHGDIDHIVGMLYVRNLMALDGKQHSTTAAKAMEPRVFYIHEDQSLSSALAAFLRTHHHLFVVVNQYRETVGLLSLEDVTESLIGHKIIDEFDAHDDLRAVAERNPRGNNEPKKHEDV